HADYRKLSVVKFYERRLEESLKSFIPLSYHPGGVETTRMLIEEANISENSIVLDIASGTGETATYIATNTNSEVIGIDLSRKMVEYANTLVKITNLDEKVKFILADAERIPLQDNIFDAALSECTLCLVPDMLRVLREMRRVVKPGAKVAVADVILAEKIPGNLANKVLHVSCIPTKRTLDDYINSFRKAGLREVKVKDVTKSVIDQINQFFKEEMGGEGSLYFPNTLEMGIRDIQKISIDLWLSGRIKYYIVSGVK
ncbi:MAG: methyltransferase domain-containing protein, partial [Candidatus Bathyarchaeia archaeon]